jgi:hypothetical protein
VADPLLAAVNEAFLSPASAPSLDGEFTMGLITLIFKGTPKKPMPPDLVDSYRPITLLNTDYKIIAKAITRRVAPALGLVVDETQTAFFFFFDRQPVTRGLRGAGHLRVTSMGR